MRYKKNEQTMIILSRVFLYPIRFPHIQAVPLKVKLEIFLGKMKEIAPLGPCQDKRPSMRKQHKHDMCNLVICEHLRNTCELLQHLHSFLKSE